MLSRYQQVIIYQKYFCQASDSQKKEDFRYSIYTQIFNGDLLIKLTKQNQSRASMLFELPQNQKYDKKNLKRTYIQIKDDSDQYNFEMPPVKKNHSSQTIIIDIDVEPQPINPNPYALIQECPTIKLTTDQMKADPLLLFIELQKKYEKFGAIKLISCDDWNPPFSFTYIQKGITTRLQVLSSLSKASSFEQKIQAYSRKSFEVHAKHFQNKYKYKTNPPGKTTEQKNEYEFWSLVSNPKYKDLKVQVQYAADLPVLKYGSGFPLLSNANSQNSHFQYHKSLFNLNNIYKSTSSLLKIVELKGQKISGITYPWVYIGMKFASFCWHVEDLYINSINYNHQGATKTWYIVPKSYKQKFDGFVKKKHQKLLQSKPDLLHRITLMIDPIQLINAGIKVYKINQQERCYVITFTKAYHCGFSHGYNVGQAINYLSELALPDAKQAFIEYEKYMGKKMAIFPLEWPIHEMYLNRQKYCETEKFKQFITKQYEQMCLKQYHQVCEIINKHKIMEYSLIEKKNLKYDRNLCALCKNYCYLSYLKCAQCNKNYCLAHFKGCCQQEQYKLYLRQPNENRKNLLILMNKIKFVGE